MDMSIIYRYDGEIVENWEPIASYRKGYHILSLMYDKDATEDSRHTWTIEITASGGNITIPANGAWTVLSSTGLRASRWDGTLYAEDSVPITRLGLTAPGITEDYDIETIEVPQADESDTLSYYHFGSLVRDLVIRESIGNSHGMYFNTSFNNSLITSTCSVSNNKWNGPGAVTTPDIDTIDHVEIRALDAEWDVSFDQGVTWVAWDGSAWAAGITMTESTLEDIPSAAWTGPARIRGTVQSGGHIESIYALEGTV